MRNQLKLFSTIISLTFVVLATPMVSAITLDRQVADADQPYVDFMSEKLNVQIPDALSEGSLTHDGGLTRAGLCELFYLSKEKPESPKATFTDLKGLSEELINAVSFCKDAGIAKGDELKPTFRPLDVVSRQEMAKMLLKYLGIDPVNDEEATSLLEFFADHKELNWIPDSPDSLHFYMGRLVQLGVIRGINGMLAPNTAMYFDHFASALTKTLIPAEENKSLTESGAVAEDFVRVAKGEDVQTVLDEKVDTTPLLSGDAKLEVALSSDTPKKGLVPMGASHVPYTFLDFSAIGGDVTLESITLTRRDIGNSQDFTAVRLFQGVLEIADSRSFNNDNTAPFKLIKPLVIPAGKKITIKILADVSSTAATHFDSIGILENAHIKATSNARAVPVSGASLFGNSQQIAAITVGTAVYQMVDPQGATAGEFTLGDLERVLTQINISLGPEESATLTEIRFRNRGSATLATDIKNLKLRLDDKVVETDVSIVDNQVVVFTLKTPLKIETGSSLNFEVLGDIMGGFERTVGIDIEENDDIILMGNDFNFNLNVTKSAGSSVIVADRITGTRLSFLPSSKNPTAKDSAPNALDQEVLRVKIINAGGAVEIANLPWAIIPANGGNSINISDVKLWELDDTGKKLKVLAGPFRPVGKGINTAEQGFWRERFTLAANSSKEYSVTVDVSPTVVQGETYTFHLINSAVVGLTATLGLTVTSGFQVTNVDSRSDPLFDGSATGTKFLSTAIIGNLQTISSPRLTFGLSTSPTTQIAVRNSQGVDLVGFDAQASSASTIKMTSLVATLTDATGIPGALVRGVACSATAATASDLGVVELSTIVDGKLVHLDGPRQIDATGRVNFTGFSQMIPAGETIKLVITASIQSATQNVCVSFRIAADTDVSAQDSNGRALAPTTQIIAANTNGAANIPTAYILAATSGQVRVSVSSSTPAERQVIAGSADVEFSKIKFTASTIEGVKIQKLRLFNATPATNAAISSVGLWVGDKKIATSTLNSSGYAIFENLNLDVPQDGASTVSVKGNINNSIDVINIAGMAPRFVVRNLEDNWKDSSTPGAPNGTGSESGLAAGQNGDVKAVGLASGLELLNTNIATDALSGNRNFSTGVLANSECDSVGVVTGATGCTGIISGAVSITGNTLAKAQYIYNTILKVALADDSPVGNLGSASGTEKSVFKVTVSAAANSTAALPREASVQFLYLTVSGDAECSDFQLFGPSNNYTVAIAASNVVHRTNTIGTTGGLATEHSSRTSVVPFAITGPDATVGYGGSKTYLVKCKLSAITDTNSPQRSLEVKIDEFGTFTGGSDVIWRENGGSSVLVSWIYDENGKTELAPTSPLMAFGSSFITADAAAPLPATSTDLSATVTSMFGRTTAAGTSRVYWSLPIDPATAIAGDYFIDPTNAAGAGGNIAATAITTTGNVLFISDTFGLVSGAASQTDYAGTLSTDAIGSAASPGNTNAAAVTDKSNIRNF